MNIFPRSAVSLPLVDKLPIFSLPCRRVSVMAKSAKSMLANSVGIRLIVRVPLWAVCLVAILFARASFSDILRASHGHQVVGIDAASMPARRFNAVAARIYFTAKYSVEAMPTSLEVKLRTAALAWPAFSILGPSNAFRWYDLQLKQGSLFPAVAVQVISNKKDYAFQAPVLTSWYRVQFTIWAQPDSAATDAVLQAILGFLMQFNATGNPGQNAYAPNFMLNNLTGMEPALQPPVFKRVADFMMYSNDSL